MVVKMLPADWPRRADLERLVGIQLPDSMLEHLADLAGLDLLGLIDKGGATMQEAKEEVERVLRAVGGFVQPPGPVEKMRPQREMGRRSEEDGGKVPYKIALSQALVGEAMKEERIWQFRDQRLSKRRLRPEEVKPWVLERAKLDGLPTRIVRGVVLPDTSVVHVVDGKYVLKNPVAFQTFGAVDAEPLLVYENGIGGKIMAIPVHMGGVLDELRLLSLLLSDKYGWFQEQAATHVLTDSIPLHVPIKALFNGTSPYSSQAKIVLAIDPAMTPREVAEEYAKIRAMVAGTRHRNLSDKHKLLAGFSSTRPEAESWEDRMASWNEHHARGKDYSVHDPAWEYADLKMFTRDCKAAYRRLLHPQYKTITQPLSFRDQGYGFKQVPTREKIHLIGKRGKGNTHEG